MIGQWSCDYTVITCLMPSGLDKINVIMRSQSQEQENDAEGLCKIVFWIHVLCRILGI